MTRRIAYLISVLCIGFLSGMLGSLVISWEKTVPTGSIAAFRQNSNQTFFAPQAADVILKTAPSIVRLVEINSSKIIPHVFGVIVSSDRWIVVPGSVKTIKNKILDKDGYLYEIKKNIYHPGLDISFIQSSKINSKPIELLDRSKLTDTIDGFIVTGFSSIQPLIITPVGYPFQRIIGEPLQIYELAKRFNYDQEFQGEQRAVFTLDGTLVGFTAVYGIIPISPVKDILPQIFKNTKLNLPTLPFSYRDAAWTIMSGDQKAKTYADGGAILTGTPLSQYRLRTPDGKSVRMNTGDSIVAVNGERLDRNRGLTDIIQQYRVGDSVTLSIITTDKKEKDIKIILESFK